MEPHFLADQVDAHRLLVQVGTGRNTADYIDNQKIYSQGEEASFVFFVQEGSVKLTIRLEGGLELSLGIAQKGQFFGEACLHDIPIRLASATAIGDCRITSVTKEALLSTIYSQPRFARMFVDYLASHNSWVQRHLLDHLLEPTAAL